MRFLYEQLLLGAAALFSVASAQDRADNINMCENAPKGSTSTSGKDWDKEGPYEWCDTRWQYGAVVKKVEVWSAMYHVRGIRLTFSDGWVSPIRGSTTGDITERGVIEWDVGAPVTKLNRANNWGGYGGDAVGRIWIDAGGKSLNVGSDTGSYGGEPVELHTGLLLGAHGRSGDFLDTLEWMLMSADIVDSEVTAFKYPPESSNLAEWNEKQKGIESISLDDLYYSNTSPAGSSNQTYKFDKSVKKASTKTVTDQDSHAFGASIGFKISAEIDVPLFAKVTAETSTQYSYTYTKTHSEAIATSDEMTLTYTQGGGTYATDFTAVTRITLGDGQKFDIEQPHHYESVGWSNAQADCKNIPLDQIPVGATMGETAPIKTTPDEKKKRGVAFRG
ncbi:hypothetical protein N0V90_003528 [Kalmusia sp. IMI 367209]|nr:hypothetical protein N0V90_003528 [Kalmusia sp. IMI 367209]